MVSKLYVYVFSLLLLFFPKTIESTYVGVEPEDNCLFQNPLCFYNLDVLRYLQVLHQKQEYAQMAKFFYGPMKEQLGEKELALFLSEVDFGYALKRVGIKEKGVRQWSLTYQRTILGTQENFKLEAAVVNDTCRVYLDENQWINFFKFR